MKKRPLVVIERQILFDAVTNGREIANAIGLSPISEEVAEMERRDSLLRLEAVAPLVPMVEHHTGFLANVFTNVQRVQAQERGVVLEEESWRAAFEQQRSMLNVSAMSLVSLLVDLGALAVTVDEQSSEQSEENES